MKKWYFPPKIFYKGLSSNNINPQTARFSSMATIQNPHISTFPQHPNPKFKTHFRASIIVSQKQQKPKNDNKAAYEEKKKASVDYDKGIHKVTVRIDGFRKSDLPKHQRLRVEGDRFQKDWGVSEVVEKIMKINHWDDIEGVLNCWAGRFARKNFPILIKVSFLYNKK